MKTISISLREASYIFPTLVDRLRANGERAVLTEDGHPIAELIPIASDQDAKPAQVPGPRTGPRRVYDEVTGLAVVTARPGARKVTSEEIHQALEDFP